METTSVFFKTVDVEGKVDPAGIRLVSNPLYEQKRLLNRSKATLCIRLAKRTKDQAEKTLTRPHAAAALKA